MPTLAGRWEQRGEAKMPLRLTERQFGMPSEEIRQRIADAEPVDPEPQATEPTATILPFHRPAAPPHDRERIPYFPDLRIACGHFRAGRTDAATLCAVSAGYGRLDPERHFVARAIGNSMDGGKHPVRDGDYLLLELIDPDAAGSITGDTLVIERQGLGEAQYLLRTVARTPDGRYFLKAANPAYPDDEADTEMHTLARLKGVLDPDDLRIGGPGG
jgi:phage repressor protein C with HTH and peptisase S24 domain